MPALPQTLTLPKLASSDPEAIRRWCDDYASAMHRQWTAAVHTLNALSIVDTEANRPTTPELDHIFHTASDTGQMYVAREGAWYEFGPGAGTLNVKGFGALGDGVNDQTAVAAAFAVSGPKTVYFPGTGTYMVDNLDIVDDDTTVIIGAGAVVKRRSTTGNASIFGVLANRVKFYGPGVIDGNSANLAGDLNLVAINLNSGVSATADISDVLVKGLTIRNMPNLGAGQAGDALRTPGDSATYTVRHVRLLDNYIHDCARNGFTLTNCEYVTIGHNQFQDCTQAGIDLEGTASLKVKHVAVAGNTYRNVTGTGSITVTVVASAGTFTRSAGSYITDGFTVGHLVTWTGFTNAGNNTAKFISVLTATVMTVSETTGLVDETGDGNEGASVGGRFMDLGGDHVTVVGNIADIGTMVKGTDAFNITAGADITLLGNLVRNARNGMLISGNARVQAIANRFYYCGSRGIDCGSANLHAVSNYFHHWNVTGDTDSSQRVALRVSAGGNAYIADNVFHKDSGFASTVIDLGSTGNNRVGSNKYTGASVGNRVAGRVATDEIDDLVGTEAKTSNTTVSATSDFGKTFTNEGASGTITFTLPASVVGLRVRFIRVATQSLRVDPNGTEIIRGGGAGKYLQLDADGDNVMLQCVAAGTWEIVAVIGTPSYQP